MANFVKCEEDGLAPRLIDGKFLAKYLILARIIELLGHANFPLGRNPFPEGGVQC